VLQLPEILPVLAPMLLPLGLQRLPPCSLTLLHHSASLFLFLLCLTLVLLLAIIIRLDLRMVTGFADLRNMRVVTMKMLYAFQKGDFLDCG
jgi:hypothetical protein